MEQLGADSMLSKILQFRKSLLAKISIAVSDEIDSFVTDYYEDLKCDEVLSSTDDEDSDDIKILEIKRNGTRQAEDNEGPQKKKPRITKCINGHPKDANPPPRREDTLCTNEGESDGDLKRPTDATPPRRQEDAPCTKEGESNSVTTDTTEEEPHVTKPDIESEASIAINEEMERFYMYYYSD